MIQRENIKIMVGGKTIGVAESAQLTFTDDSEPSTREFSDLWRTPNFEQTIEIGGAMVHDPRQNICDLARDLMSGKWDLLIQRQMGHLPRKMKKALHADYRRITKWKRKLAAHIHRRSIKIRNAEMVITLDQQSKLRAIFYGAAIGHGCTVHSNDINKAIKNLKHRRL